MSAPGADVTACNTTGSKESARLARSSVANVTRTRTAAGTSGSLSPPMEKISLRKENGRWMLRCPSRGTLDTHSWRDAHRIMLRLVARSPMLSD